MTRIDRRFKNLYNYKLLVNCGIIYILNTKL